MTQTKKEVIEEVCALIEKELNKQEEFLNNAKFKEEDMSYQQGVSHGMSRALSVAGREVLKIIQAEEQAKDVPS